MPPNPETIDRLYQMYGATPLAALIATLMVAVVALFMLLWRSWTTHLRDAVRLAPIAEKVTAAVDNNTRVLSSVQEAILQLRADSLARRSGRKAVDLESSSAGLKAATP